MSRIIMCLTAAALVAFAADSGRAADWSLETNIFAEKSDKPSETALAIFHDSRVYDFVGDQTTIHHPAAGRFTLLDASKKCRTEISAEQLAKLSDRAEAAALKRSGELSRAAAKADFAISWDESRREIICRHTQLTYLATGIPEDAARVRQFREFADGCARLNGIQPGRLAPQARLVLNEQLSRRGLIPTSVALTTTSDDGTKQVRRSEHKITAKLTDDDRARIASANLAAERYASESFAQFHGVAAKR